MMLLPLLSLLILPVAVMCHLRGDIDAFMKTLPLI
jgi:hypothetical protein